MKILITGSTGFIGNHVVQHLLKRGGFSLICTSTDQLKAQAFSWFEKVKYIECDLNEKKENYFEFFECPDLLIHLAWEGLPNYNESFHIDRNLPANCLFIKNMLKNGLKHLSVTGTCFEYGLQEGCLNENIATIPVTSYAIAKDTLRKYIELLRKQFNFHFNWIRLFYIYGDGQRPSSILELLKKSVRNGDTIFNMSGGDQLRDYLHIDDVAENIIDISLQNDFDGIVNCCSGNPISIKDLVKRYLKDNNISIKLNLGHYPYPDYEPMKFWGDNQLLQKLTRKHNES